MPGTLVQALDSWSWAGLQCLGFTLYFFCKLCSPLIKDNFPKDSKNVLDYPAAFKNYKVDTNSDLQNDIHGKSWLEEEEGLQRPPICTSGGSNQRERFCSQTIKKHLLCPDGNLPGD